MHQSLFPQIWFSDEYSPAEFFAEAAEQGVKFMQIAGENVGHAERLAIIDGKTLDDFLDPSEYTPPLSYTVHQNGTVTINP
jgi:hypothetical protein